MKKIFMVLFVVLSLNGITQNQNFYFTSPKADAKFVNPEQVILLKSFGDILNVDPSLINLYNENKEVSIRINVKDNNLLFVTPMQLLERDASYKLVIDDNALRFSDGFSKHFSLDFTTERENNEHYLQRFYEKQDDIEMSYQIEREDLEYNYNPPENDNSYPADFPIPYVENVNDPLPGYLFLNIGARNAPDYNSYAVILDNNAIPIWFTAANRRDLKILADGTFTHDFRNNANLDLQGYFIRNDQLKVTDTIRMGNGYYVDTHDMLLLDNGHYLMMAYDPQVVDMSEIVEGGNPEAIVEGFVVQEVDKDRNVYFEWRSWDYLEITDVSDTVDLTAEEIDYVHGNAFEFDLEGNLMMSLRNMEEITKINYQTGDIIWRLGLRAKNNMFTFNDTIGWSWQHDIRQLPNGNITLFDNGRNHIPESFTQAVEYEIDENNMTATLVWNHREDPDIYRGATGSHRRISEDRSLIGWGMGSPLLATEISTNGERHLDLLGPDGTNDYRVQRFEWIHNVFTFNKDTLDFGEYDDYVPVSRTFKITNQMEDDTIIISSAHNHLDDFWLVSQLPITLVPGEEDNIIVNFQPQGTGEFNDVLTLNYDNADTTERIARQIVITGRTPTGIHEYENNKITIHPNPVSGLLHIETELEGEKIIKIYTVTGQQILEYNISEKNFQFPTQNLIPGLYTGIIKSDNGIATFKFIKD